MHWTDMDLELQRRMDGAVPSVSTTFDLFYSYPVRVYNKYSPNVSERCIPIELDDCGTT